jgi:Integral membrane protein, interacts with FtsH
MNETMITSVENASTALLHKVFGWMFVGLIVSALTAMFVAATPAVTNVVLGNQAVFFALIIVELALVVGLTWAIARISATTAMALFLLYSFVSGLTLSVIVLVYTDASLASTFVIAAGMFGIMAVYGYATHRDLSRLGSIMLMGLIGIILAGVVNIFLGSNGLDIAISAIAIIIFTALTAYDMQKIKAMGTMATDDDGRSKQAVFGALILYLDFINIFLNLLRFTGRRRN